MRAGRGGGPGGHGRGRNPRTRRIEPAVPRLVEVTIEALGGKGDGIATLDGKPLFVPFTTPGDRVVARIEGKRGDGLAAGLIEVRAAGPQRMAPSCRHFGTCGGCSVQHLTPRAYSEWKRSQVATALARQGLADVPLAPLLQVPPGQRRRASFAFVRTNAGVVVGFNARATHRVVDVEECPAIDLALAGLLPALRTMLAEVVEPSTSGGVSVTMVGEGLDVVVECEARLDLADREKLALFAESHDLTRLSWRRPSFGGIEPVAQRRPATVVLGGVPVELPPGAFLQPSLAGERVIVELVLAAVGTADPVCDLFSGCGTLAFPLAARAAVHAVEGESEALRALRNAADQAGLRLTTEARDLSRRPLLPGELRRFGAVVFDPPRAGAPEQAAMLAEGGPPLVVGVSCHPASFAHDARLLVAGGYRLEHVTPVDQFPWSAHVELVGVFVRS